MSKNFWNEGTRIVLDALLSAFTDFTDDERKEGISIAYDFFRSKHSNNWLKIHGIPMRRRAR